MTESQAQNQVQTTENKPSDKELNFRAIEAKLRQETAARIEAERKAEEALRLAHEATSKRQSVEEDEDDEPYVAPKKLEKKLAKFGQSTQTDIQKAMEMAKQSAKEELKQEMWLEKNQDFHQIMNNEQLLDKFYQSNRELADTILQMPQGFPRQQLVYKNIKALGLDKPEQKQPSIQEKIDANRRSPYYQPSGVASAPYAAAGDFSPAGQKNAHQKMQELKNRLRLG